MATIYDIAKKCGVSASTVSYVLSGNGDARRIAADTQLRVLQAAEALGYQRRGGAPETPRSSAEPMITVYYPKRDFAVSLVSMLEGVNQAIDSEIFPIRLNISTYEIGGLGQKKELWSASGPDAAIIVSPTPKDLHLLEEKKTLTPTVLFYRELDGYSSVNTDHKTAALLAANHALDSGGHDIALVTNPFRQYAISSRGQFMLDAFLAAGVNMQDRVFFSDNSIDAGYELGWEMVRKNKLSKVILCVYDMVALGIMSALNEAGIHIGEDVKILATSTSPQYLFSRSYPPMTVVDLHSQEVAMKSMTLALHLATRQITGEQHLIVQPSIIYRQSCPLIPHLG